VPTNQIRHNLHFACFPKTARVCTVSANALRRAVAFPFYVVALILSYLSDLIGANAATIAGDNWPG
jgi:hypothetical protein